MTEHAQQHEPALPKRDPVDYLTLPLEAWTLVDLSNALGLERTQSLFNTSRGNVRVLRHRNRTSTARMELLYAEVRKDEARIRRALVTKYTAQAIINSQKEPTP